MFDTANRQTCTVRASRTSTPLHALTTLNDPTWVEAARVLAEKSHEGRRRTSPAGSRMPSAASSAAGPPTTTSKPSCGCTAGSWRSTRPMRTRPSSSWRVGESPRDEALDPAEHAALASVCLAIFNLDEALTRE